MKIVVSTKHLSNSILKAIDKKASLFEIKGKEELIVFAGEKGVSDVNIGYNSNQGYYNFNYKALFNPVQWYKIHLFLKQLEEQPIVMEFDHYDSEKIIEQSEIKFSQFIIRFYA